MVERRIAILSKNAQLLRFLELTCRLYGFEVDCDTELPMVTSPYFLILADTDTVPVSRQFLVNLVTVSSRGKEGERHLRIPVSLKHLETLLLQGIEADSTAQESRQQKQAITVYDMEKKQVMLNDCLLTLSDYEMRILKTICQGLGEPIARDALKKLLNEAKGNMVDVYVHHLRQKIATACEYPVIQSVRGVGYRSDWIWLE